MGGNLKMSRHLPSVDMTSLGWRPVILRWPILRPRRGVVLPYR